MTEENTPAVGPTGNMVAGWNKACNGSMSSFGRPSSIEARNGHQPLRVQPVMDKLKKKYYPNASLNDIRKSKTRRKKRRRDLDGEEHELAQLPHTA